MKHLIRVPQHELRVRSGNRTDSPDNRHRDVMSLFGELGTQPRKDAGILFRLERLPDAAPAYIIRSSVLPENPTTSTEVREDITGVPTGTLVSFRLSINAIQRLKVGGIRPVPSDFFPAGPRFDDEDEWDDLASTQPNTPSSESQVFLTEWLESKLHPALVEVSVINHQREVVGAFRNRKRNIPNTKVIQVDLIDGIAKVADTEALDELLRNGVGRARSYGCGLLTLRALP